MMRAIVLTASIGYLPTEVSPDSITASAPSSTALATSDASARVGRECSIIDSSIWVATMTGLAFSLAIWMARFCTSGTSSSGSSTPRSPRATMIASNASTIASRLSMASGFSSLAMTGHPAADAVHHLVHQFDVGGRADERQRDQVDAEAQRELEVVDVLLGQRRARRRSCPGSEMPLLLLTGPPSVTVQTTSLPSMCSTTRPTLPSSISSRSPGGGVLRPAACRWSTPGRGCRRRRRR